MIDYQLHDEAEQDLDAAAAFYEDRVSGLGIEFLEEVEDAIHQIRAHPFAHQLWPDILPKLPIRRKLLNRFPYGLPFLIHSDRLIVLAIAHLSREPGWWLSRIDTASHDTQG